MKGLPFSLSMLLVALLLGPAAAAGSAGLSLSNASASATLTGDTEWTLSKTGTLNPTDSTVTWTITATQVATTPGQLVINGQMTVTNDGNEPATIGNIIVNLQTRFGSAWVTRSTDVADATQGDAATTAKIHAAASSENKSTWTENSASGALNFTDATNNTLFSLVPQVLIGAGETRTLLFSASFNNNVLNLTPGTQIRAEVIVTFGNATTSGNSTANVDINGNGNIDADEARVRSVPSRLTVTVPAPVNGNGTVTLSDTLGDIVTTGTASISNISINLGGTSGTVTGTVAGGANGGTVTNCAHLTSPDQTVSSGGSTFTIVQGMNLQSCNTVVVGAPTCTPGTAGCSWRQGDMLTYTQAQWGTAGMTARSLLNSTFAQLYPSGFIVGGAHVISFTQSDRLATYITTQSGPAAPLDQNLLNPDSSSSGVFGAQVVTLQLNVDYNETNHISGLYDLGDLRFCGTSLSALNNKTVAEFLATANLILGGDTTQAFTVGTTSSIVNSLNQAFDGGTPSTFAQTFLFSAPCP